MLVKEHQNLDFWEGDVSHSSSIRIYRCPYTLQLAAELVLTICLHVSTSLWSLALNWAAVRESVRIAESKSARKTVRIEGGGGRIEGESAIL